MDEGGLNLQKSVEDGSNASPSQDLCVDVSGSIGDAVAGDEIQVLKKDVEQCEACAGDSVESSGTLVCRICLANAKGDMLISPCHCRGTLGFVHRACLERWFSESGRSECEMCRYTYRTTSTLRYTLLESLRIWYRHPHNRRLLCTDILLCILLTIIGFGMTLICVAALHYFITKVEDPMDFPRTWTVGCLIVFLIIVILSYVLNIFLVVRSQIIPWYRWWQNNRRVKLLLE
ncbi:E3 ubiquitin-protein ligase MARCHF2-like [Lutzomyia longipalpis]|uniref:E3 ubiquitin-protein ligase MARCHF2-like n=1 Tax=Lutzomyia longipalpis TaxID=7200 RepID=UPI002484664A|nr:E3 ubiquitin-protein ligase MARCHF2-like [Lutzomyia longipalpis]